MQSPVSGPWKILAVAGIAVALVSIAISLVVITRRRPDPEPDRRRAADREAVDKLQQKTRDREIARLKERLEKQSDSSTLEKYFKRIQELERDKTQLAGRLKDVRAENQKLKARVLDLETSRVKTPGVVPKKPATEKDKTIADIVEKHASAVVIVRSNVGTGAGFFISPDGMVATNYHVISGSRRIYVEHVIEKGGRKQRLRYAAEAYAIDVKNDLALVRASTRETTPMLILAGNEPLRVGDPVIAIGNPGVGDTILDYSVSNGIISSLTRRLGDRMYLQTTAAINPGNSGGPLLTMAGRVVGVVTAKGRGVENIGFAVPVSLLQTLYQGRDTTFRIRGTLSDWEAKDGLTFKHDISRGIKLDTTITKIILDEDHNRLLALDYDKNSLMVISLSQGKVLKTLYTGSEPSDLALDPKRKYAWVSNSASKNLVKIDIEQMRITETINLSVAPTYLVLGRGYIWTGQRSGQLHVVSLANNRGYATSFGYTSVGYDRKRDLLIAGFGGYWLHAIPASRFGAIVKKLARLAPRAFKERQDLVTQLQKGTKKHQIQAGHVGYSGSARLLVDEANGMMYFNRIAIRLDRLDSVVGVFKPNPYSRSSSMAVRNFMARFPELDQIMTVSPDGNWAANGTHIFNARRFTVHKELPIPTGAIAFSKDSKVVYFFDVINRMILPLEVTK